MYRKQQLWQSVEAAGMFPRDRWANPLVMSFESGGGHTSRRLQSDGGGNPSNRFPPPPQCLQKLGRKLRTAENWRRQAKGSELLLSQPISTRSRAPSCCRGGEGDGSEKGPYANSNTALIFPHR